MAQSARMAAEAYHTPIPHFTAKVTKGNNAFVEAAFASRHLNENDSILLRNSGGEEWEVSAEKFREDSNEMKMTEFHIFKNDNYLCHGDYCLFELIETNPVVLNVIMFRANDYDD